MELISYKHGGSVRASLLLARRVGPCGRCRSFLLAAGRKAAHAISFCRALAAWPRASARVRPAAGVASLQLGSVDKHGLSWASLACGPNFPKGGSNVDAASAGRPLAIPVQGTQRANWTKVGGS